MVINLFIRFLFVHLFSKIQESKSYVHLFICFQKQQNRQVLSFVKSYLETELQISDPFVEFRHLFSCLAGNLFPDKFEQHEREEVLATTLVQTNDIDQNQAAADQASVSSIANVDEQQTSPIKAKTTIPRESKILLADVSQIK
jgi:hypothetical protein